MRRPLPTLPAALLCVSLVAGCRPAAPDTESTIPSSAAPSATVSTGVPARSEVDEALRARLPQDMRDRGVLRVRVDPTVPPLAMLTEDGGSLRGAEVELVEAVAKRWGLRVEWTRMGPEGLLSDLTATETDLAVGALRTRDLPTVTHGVALFTAGVRWAVPAGNPADLYPGGMCGRTVAVHEDTPLRLGDVAHREELCENRSDPMQLRSYSGQDQATAALVGGKVDALVGLAPSIDYAVDHAGGRIEPLGTEYQRDRVAIAVPRRPEDLALLVTTTLVELRADGVVAQIEGEWGLAERDAPFYAVR